MSTGHGNRRSKGLAAMASLAVLFVVVAGIFFYNAQAITDQRDAALVSNAAGRLRADVERYVSDMNLVANGQPADPDASLERIDQTAKALVAGGEVPAVQGGGEIELPRPPQSDLLRRKLHQQRKLTDELADRGRDLQATEPGTPERDQAVQDLRVVGAQLSSVTSDVVGQITRENRDSLERSNRIERMLGLGAGVAAVTVGFLFMRAGRNREEARYRALAHNSADLVIVADADGAIRYASQSAATILGRDADDLRGRRYLDLVHPDDRDLVQAALGELEALPGAPVRVQYRLHHELGHWLVVETSWANLLDDSAVRGMVANTRDVSDRHALEEELRRKAFRDDLTALPNRALFGDRVEQAVQRAHKGGGVVTVLFVDLDDFKTVNDSLGHTTGDHLLQAVAERITACIRVTDTAARLGGDEFGILLTDGSTVDTAESLAQRLLTSLRDPFDVDGRPLVVTASIGIACQLGTQVTSEAILRDADVAMYAAKSQGKGRAAVFADQMHREVVERQRLGSDLQLALANGELEVFYQPLVDLTTGVVAGVEALLRWHHPTRGSIPPTVFIPVAEEIGMIVEIGAWVLDQACHQIVDWSTRHEAVRDLAVTVNLSPVQLVTERLFDDVAGAIERSGIAPSSLILEITEGALSGDNDKVVAGLVRLRSIGVRLAIDDFGTGYSSLSQLRMLPVDMLKIDKSFIDGTADGGRGTALLHSIIDLGRVLNLEVVAEGIEHPEQAEVLHESGSHLGQGFYYAVPASPADLEQLMARGLIDPIRHGITVA